VDKSGSVVVLVVLMLVVLVALVLLGFFRCGACSSVVDAACSLGRLLGN